MLINWLGHSSFKLKTGETTIYIDPYGNEEYYNEQADFILVSKWEYSHCSLSLIKKIRGESTVIIGTPEVASQIFGCTIMRPFETRDYERLKITALPAVFKPLRGISEQGEALGFLLELEKKALYYTSDAGYFPELKQLKADIVIVPVGGTGTMNAKQAAEFVKMLKPKTAIPAHYGKIVGTIDDAELFKELVEADRETEVLILKEGMPAEL